MDRLCEQGLTFCPVNKARSIVPTDGNWRRMWTLEAFAATAPISASKFCLRQLGNFALATADKPTDIRAPCSISQNGLQIDFLRIAASDPPRGVFNKPLPYRILKNDRLRPCVQGCDVSQMFRSKDPKSAAGASSWTMCEASGIGVKLFAFSMSRTCSP